MKLKWSNHESHPTNQNLFLEDGTCVAHLYRMITGQWTISGYTGIIGTFVSPSAIADPEDAKKWAVETIRQHFKSLTEFMNKFQEQSV